MKTIESLITEVKKILDKNPETQSLVTSLTKENYILVRNALGHLLTQEQKEAEKSGKVNVKLRNNVRIIFYIIDLIKVIDGHQEILKNAQRTLENIPETKGLSESSFTSKSVLVIRQCLDIMCEKLFKNEPGKENIVNQLNKVRSDLTLITSLEYPTETLEFLHSFLESAQKIALTNYLISDMMDGKSKNKDEAFTWALKNENSKFAAALLAHPFSFMLTNYAKMEIINQHAGKAEFKTPEKINEILSGNHTSLKEIYGESAFYTNLSLAKKLSKSMQGFLDQVSRPTNPAENKNEQATVIIGPSYK